ncbi:putative odorant receptor 85d isoform X3 [Cydia pomonella]|uniref:putative odorant receptor 85d isoform X3 n=1 Tax=Cydia pomonella TaxID=82600 RepID=UPI002ADDECEC|nr:putative odorant receptor 85d isoform X3 [Cydia pomonella]
MSSSAKEEFLAGMDYLSVITSRIFLYPFLGRSKTKLLCYYFICSLIIFASFQQFVFLCVSKLNSFLDIVNIAPNIGVCAMSVTKYIKVNSNKELYNLIFVHFRTDMWDIVSEKCQENVKILKRYQKIIHFITIWFVYYVVPLILIVTSFPILIMYYDNMVLGKELEHRYPFEAWYPFDKVKWYYAAYAWESFITGLVVCIYTFSDLINVSYVAYICLELKLLGTHLKELIGAEDIKQLKSSQNATAIHYKIRQKLRGYIIKHNFLANISSQLDIIFGDIMLVNYTFGSVFMCLTAFTFTVTDELYTTLRCFFFLISLVISMLNQCVIGQCVSDHSEQLTQALYDSKWTYGDRQTRQLVLMLIMRMQKPFQLTAKGYIAMNLDTFTTICSTSYQFFNLLRTMYDPKAN